MVFSLILPFPTPFSFSLSLFRATYRTIIITHIRPLTYPILVLSSCFLFMEKHTSNKRYNAGDASREINRQINK
ncbi:hypothetical protein BDQ94DRAFT_15608 [Aspergillus welwitschiae]|uniref:Uncharacterized protein n=1 Tax=Aspergillus welwitschiae TaxID=1341132 RepID=A0A3F3Q6M2_9EURO|nr:hypothetical protein BDQ94DRAFT_15608 [Aspergillus welwitschiae]RDH34813.1 hypothetical protein BDQ94DRAFT_15608 [Aspergillus welwitschiae]